MSRRKSQIKASYQCNVPWVPFCVSNLYKECIQNQRMIFNHITWRTGDGTRCLRPAGAGHISGGGEGGDAHEQAEKGRTPGETHNESPGTRNIFDTQLPVDLCIMCSRPAVSVQIWAQRRVPTSFGPHGTPKPPNESCGCCTPNCTGYSYA